MSIEVHSTNPVVAAVIGGTAPRPARLAAARGVLPLPQSDMLEVLVAFTASDDREIADLARATLRSQDNTELAIAVRAPELAPTVLGYLAAQDGLGSDVYQAIIGNARTSAETLVSLAKRTRNGEVIDLISLNQQLLIRTPAVIDAILENPSRTPEAERRATETRREFFEKERGAAQIASEFRAQGNSVAAEFLEQAELGDDLSEEDARLIAEMIESSDSETDDAWLGLEFLEEIYEETQEQRSAAVEKILGELRMEHNDLPSERISIINRIMKMGMKDRAKLAMKGDREARNILIRDPNRIITQAVVSNPRITDQEIEKIASMRTVSEDILRQIANNRAWSRNYSVVHNLARNPRAPIASVMSILTRLQLKDLAALAKNRNVSEAVRRQAVRLTQSRAGR
jgi:hypothetical protein